MTSDRRIALLGTVGVPGNYGGFETLAENLVRHHHDTGRGETLTVWCSARAYPERPAAFLQAGLKYVPLDANGVQSIPYDFWSLISAVRHGADRILLLGVSGALLLPLIRMISRARIVTNIDGIEWKRDKWGRAARWFLRLSEKIAVRWSHAVIADNGGIAEHVRRTYGVEAAVIAYGGDHAVLAAPVPVPELDLPGAYAFALCRIEPENNVAMVLEAFAGQDRGPDALPLVFVGNWDKSDYGRALKARFADSPMVRLVDPIYDLGKLATLRRGASVYVHGHSAGGTNPSLVEMMHFGVPVLAFDCIFNRHTTDDRALFFADPADLIRQIGALGADEAARIGTAMRDLAIERYTWAGIAAAYFDLLERQG